MSGQQQFKLKTSGSTGDPKIIVLDREQMSLSAKLTGKVLNLKAGDRALVCLSPNYIAGLMMLVRGMILGLELTVLEPSSNPLQQINVNKCSFDFTALVPLQLETILKSDDRFRSILDRMKAILVGGAPVSSSLYHSLQQLEAPIYQTFGMTETVSHIALRRLNGPERSKTYQTMPGVEINIDQRGCLTINSPLCKNQTIITNDLVELTSDSGFIWLGRIDNVINSGGVKIKAEMVERAISEVLFEIDGSQHSQTDFFVAGLEDERLGETVCAIFEGSEFSSKTLHRIKNRLSERVTLYEIPKQYYFVERLSRLSNGKIDRRRNLEKLCRGNVRGQT